MGRFVDRDFFGAVKFKASSTVNTSKPASRSNSPCKTSGQGDIVCNDHLVHLRQSIVEWFGFLVEGRGVL